MITYMVQLDGIAWNMIRGTLTYSSYRSGASAPKAAIAVATKVGLTGEVTFVELAKPDGNSERIVASDPERPPLGSRLRAAGYVAA
jgi:hypothetical protein